MRLLRWSGYLFVVLLIVVAVVMVMGSRLPEEHAATAVAEIPAAPQRVWDVIADVGAQPKWRTGLKAVEMLPPGAGGPCWNEVQTGQVMALCVDASDPPADGKAGRRMVRIADPKLPFGGTWTYVLEPVGAAATRVTIREDGIARPAMWRFVSHYVMGEDAQVKQYLKDLGKAVAGG